MTSPIEQLAELVIGTVESVSPNEIRVALEMNAPQATALNAGAPASFPRLNGYVLVPNEAGATVCYINWVGVERASFPKGIGSKEVGLIDLPFPARKMAVSPVGTLTTLRDKGVRNIRFELSRGVIAFPSVGDQVLMPTPEQVSAIVGSKESDKRVRIGTSPMAANAAIMVNPDKIFGRHLAVLGNTGSGKSCSVAGLIRWSLAAARKERAEHGLEDHRPNSRFIVLDPNGEYARAFRDFGDDLRLFRVPPIEGGVRPLDVPAWTWNGHEWASVAHAQPGVQRPMLFQGIRELKSGQTEGIPREAVIRRYLVSYAVRVGALLAQGTQAFAGAPAARFQCARMLETIAGDVTQFAASIADAAVRTSLTGIATVANNVINSRRSGQYFNDFSVSDLESVRDALTQTADPLPDLASTAPVGEDAPRPFDVTLLADHLERVAIEQGGNVAAFVSTLGLRIKAMLADQRLGSVIARDPPTTFSAWLEDYVGNDGAANGPLAIVDLSLVPSDVVHVVVAVLSRLVFESLQRYRRQRPDGKALPTVLVLEEAHTFVRRGRDDDASITSPAQLCREVFERIAREGRKFGLGLVLSSQRPSELSPTVLAQCNTFMLHRIVNDSDQDLVGRLVPDNVGGLLRELPSLPSRQAILLGWATPIPVLVEVDELPNEQRPQSDDPDYWDVWTGRSERTVDWNAIARDWSGAPGVNSNDQNTVDEDGQDLT
ncbi:ATP-binding protein [Paraburkholderia caribensis]|uniref:ATP-binding protein n=1 Tax=Paraburkholderia caribensis TaxID=75105 RepID=UPI001CB00240|nr:ATP-binding protein [Paraburkholderia caribensis]CAG9243823.1 ATPase [Paraburkholderia caribensis]